ncbi:MAG: hypothetical protein ACRDBO_21635 [Lachnospiraceae bacterium]
MKKLIITGLVLTAALSLSACGNSNSQVDQIIAAQAATINSAAQETTVPESTAVETAAVETAAQETENEDGIDVDLTGLSATMVYAEVYNMMVYPENYLGKTVKIKGQYYAAYIEDQDAYYHYVIIADALACCESGIEIIWDNNEHEYPDEYPDNLTEVEVVGTFSMYEEDGYTYGYLATEDLMIK